MHSKITPLLIFLLLFVAENSNAYEEEDGIPLTISTQSEYGNIEKTSVKINGRNVEIVTEINNDKKISKRIGFTAYTPFFEQLGVAEDNENKTFADLTVSFNGKPLKPRVYRRGFFLGEDVTTELLKVGIGPLPDKDIDSKGVKHRGLPLDNWQGYVAYSWTPLLSPNSNNVAAIRYRAVPQFGRDEISSERFSHRVLQHCGKPDEIRKYLLDLNPAFDSVLFDRYEIPINFLPRMRNVKIEVLQPTKIDSEEQPLFSLVCGLSDRSGKAENFSGTIQSPEKIISVLVISRFAGSITKGDQ